MLDTDRKCHHLKGSVSFCRKTDERARSRKRSSSPLWTLFLLLLFTEKCRTLSGSRTPATAWRVRLLWHVIWVNHRCHSVFRVRYWVCGRCSGLSLLVTTLLVSVGLVIGGCNCSLRGQLVSYWISNINMYKANQLWFRRTNQRCGLWAGLTPYWRHI